MPHSHKPPGGRHVALQDVELNELRATINSLRQQSNANKIVDKGRSRSPAGSSSSGSSKFGRHHQQRHHGSSDSVKSDSGPTTRKPHVTAAASGEHSTKKHKSWVRLTLYGAPAMSLT